MRHPLTTCALLLATVAPYGTALQAQDCTRDAMLVFDGSASMEELGLRITEPTRIEDARSAVNDAMPEIAPIRRIGLITYGPGPDNACDGISVKFPPVADAAGPVMDAIGALEPAGLTPLTNAVRSAAEVLRYRTDPGIVVLVTDGNETCGGAPCALGSELAQTAKDLTVHVIGFRVVTDRFAWDSPDVERFPDGVSVAKCLSDQTGGMYVSTQTVDELSAALRQTLGCLIIG